MSRLEEKQRGEAWRVYVGECLRIISENTAHFSGGNYMTAKWSNIVNPKPEDTRTPEQVIDYILEQLKGVK